MDVRVVIYFVLLGLNSSRTGDRFWDVRRSRLRRTVIAAIEQENYVPSVCHAFWGEMPNIHDFLQAFGLSLLMVALSLLI